MHNLLFGVGIAIGIGIGTAVDHRMLLTIYALRNR